MNRITTLIFVSLTALNLATADVSFDFTAAEGFVGSPSAALNGQLGWTATAGILVNVDPTKEFLFVVAAQNAIYGGSSLNPQDGPLIYVQDFKFNYDRGGTEDVYNVFKLDSDLPAEIARVFFKYSTTTGNFFLRYSTGNGFDQNIKSSNPFPPSAIGMADALDPATDDLRLTWKLTRGADAASWTIAVSLENLTTASVVDLNSNPEATTWEATVTVNDGFHNDTSIFFGLSSTSALTNANVYFVSAAVFVEPSTPAISINQSGSDISVTFEGTLQESPDLGIGNWTPLDPQPASPYQYTPAAAEKRFFQAVTP